jgi:hypothetical protein
MANVEKVNFLVGVFALILTIQGKIIETYQYNR